MVLSRGQIVGGSDILETLPKRAFKVKTWNDVCSPATQELTMKTIRKANAFAASVFDAANDRYVLFVYRTIDEHRACWRAFAE